MGVLDSKDLTIESLGDELVLPCAARPMRIGGPGDVRVRPPGSKSLTNRALMLAALCGGESTLTHALVDADDARRMLAAVKQLGAHVSTDGSSVTIRGVGGHPKVDPDNNVLDLNNAGTATRFLCAAALLCDKPVTITGNERMRMRPIGELGSLLTTLGAGVAYLENDGFPPLRITPPGSLSGVDVEVPPTQSSQFVSALLLIGPFVEGGVTLRMPGGVTSASYVRMTLDLLEDLGARVQRTDDLCTVRVSGELGGFRLDIEPDASGATYWWAAGALLGGRRVFVDGFGDRSGRGHSLQGDAGFPALMEQMGCAIERDGAGVACVSTGALIPVLCDMSDMPDAVMSLAGVACFAPGTTVVRGVRTLRVKECDRINAMRVELGKIGVVVEENVNGDEDVLSITPPKGGVDCSDDAPVVEMDTYDDHRMAMSLSLLALRRPNVVIRDPGCVAKTYASYWEHFAALYGA